MGLGFRVWGFGFGVLRGPPVGAPNAMMHWLCTFLLYCLAFPLACSIGTVFGLQVAFAIYVWIGTPDGRRRLTLTMRNVSAMLLLLLALAPMLGLLGETRMMESGFGHPGLCCRDSGCGIGAVGFWMLDQGFELRGEGVWEAVCRPRDTGCGLRASGLGDVRCGIRAPGFGIRGSAAGTRGPGHGHVECGMWDAGCAFGIRHSGSGVPDSGTAFVNSGCKMRAAGVGH